MKVANGFYGTKKGWKRIENPMQKLDKDLYKFAKNHQLVLIKNKKGWPDRSFQWGDTPKVLLQVFLEREEALTYTFWASASDDRSRAECWRHQTFVKAVPINALQKELPELLQTAYSTVNGWINEYENG